MQNAAGLLDQFLSHARSAPPAASDQGGSGFSLGGLLDRPGALATGAAVGGLAGLLLGGKKPRKIAKTALKAGGVALVGGLAYKAWRDWQTSKDAQSAAAGASQTSSTAPTESVFLPQTESEEADLSRTLIRAMISAAKADGHIDDAERRRISDQLVSLPLDAADRSFVDRELEKPLDIDSVASAAKTPEQAAEVYAASLLAIEPNGVAERGYLAMLATRLNLETGLVERLHAQADAIVEG